MGENESLSLSGLNVWAERERAAHCPAHRNRARGQARLIGGGARKESGLYKLCAIVTDWENEWTHLNLRASFDNVDTHETSKMISPLDAAVTNSEDSDL